MVYSFTSPISQSGDESPDFSDRGLTAIQEVPLCLLRTTTTPITLLSGELMTGFDFKKQMPLNLLSNVGYFALNVIIGLGMVPYLIRHLGKEGYGFIPTKF
jgi:hypothetical protein